MWPLLRSTFLWVSNEAGCELWRFEFYSEKNGSWLKSEEAECWAPRGPEIPRNVYFSAARFPFLFYWIFPYFKHGLILLTTHFSNFFIEYKLWLLKVPFFQWKSSNSTTNAWRKKLHTMRPKRNHKKVLEIWVGQKNSIDEFATYATIFQA